jgi:DNA-binding HxlR family transcriptional regulator
VQAKRTYHQHCGVARALDVIGERWTLLIVRDLLLGPRRYRDLLESLDGITTNLLAKRLREMVRSGLLEKRRAAPPAFGELYALTDAGRALEPVVMELGRWGGKLLQQPRRGDQRNIGWALLSMKRRYVGGLEAIVEVEAGDRRFELTFSKERLFVEEKASERATARVRAGDQERFFDLFFRGASRAGLERTGALVISGDRKTMLAALGALGVEPFGASPVDASQDVR